MTIVFKTGSIFDSSCEALVNPVNCVGVMGKGLALQFKEKFPENFEEYAHNCYYSQCVVGDIVSVYTYEFVNLTIINCATTQHWRDNSTIDGIKRSLINLVDFCSLDEIKSVAIPKLGCGCGGLDWNEVKPLIVEICGKSQDILFEIYEQQNN